MTQLRTAAECGYWGSMKNIDGHAMRYDHKHKSMRWVIFGYLDGGTHTNLPYLPADLIAGMCNGEKLNLPAWVKKSQSRDMNGLKIRLSLCSVNRDSITDSPSLSGTKIQPIACQGLKRRVADFADMSFANKEICISLFGFNKRRKIWISDDCHETVDIDGGNRCSSCDKVFSQIRHRSPEYGVLYPNKENPHSSNLLPSTEAVSKFIANQYEKFDSDDTFLKDESVLLHAKVLSSMGYNKRISLSTNKYFGSCKGNSPSCSCFHVWEILRCDKNIDYCPQCSSANTKNRRSERGKKNNQKGGKQAARHELILIAQNP